MKPIWCRSWLGCCSGLWWGPSRSTCPTGWSSAWARRAAPSSSACWWATSAASGRFRLHVPAAAKNLSRELGLMLFLAGAGVNAGAHFVEILQQQGASLLLAGALITTLSVLAGLVVMHRVYHMNVLSTMGALMRLHDQPARFGRRQPLKPRPTCRRCRMPVYTRWR